MRFLLVLTSVFIYSSSLFAETHTLTLAQAIAIARTQNPDVLLALLDARKAWEAVLIQQDAFYPKVFAGSGLAYTSGFPISIEGSAPSVVQAKAIASIYDRSQKFKVAESKENARGAAMNIEVRQDDAVMRAIELFLDAAHARQSTT